jgi:hypothetical protein
MESEMAFSSELARVGLVSVVAVIIGINTLTSLLSPSNVKAPPVDGPPLYQAAALPIRAEPEAARIALTDTRPKPAKVMPTAAALLALPQTGPAADKSTTGLAPLSQAPETPAPPPAVAQAESSPKPEKRAAAPKRAKQAQWGHSSIPPGSPRPPNQVGTRPPIYTHAVQMSVY